MLAERGEEWLALRGEGGMMLNANDSAPFSFGLEALRLIEGERPDGDVALYSLIDGAKFADLGKIRLPGDGSVELYPLLGEMARKDAIDAGPILLRHALGAQCPVLAKILGAPESANFSSVIVSDEPVSALLQKLKWLTDVTHDDGTEWVMRYYDPLILPHWLAVLEEAQRTLVLAGISAWLYSDVRGRAQIIMGNAAEASAQLGSEPMRIDQQQFDELMNKTLPYMMMDQLVSDDPQVLSIVPPYERYDFLSQQLSKAQSYGLASPADLKSYCLLSLMFDADFDKAPVVASTLAAVNSPVSFSERILGWTPEQWDLLDANEGLGK